ncbi:MAG: PorV/PorQ family protein [Chloroherpetonaceae bacterium]|nr:PorV/PorQ family protein [Chloroherpetonaceae bacterium]
MNRLKMPIQFAKVSLRQVFFLALTFAALNLPISLSSQTLFPDLGGQRVGISGFQFLKIPVSARSAALGETGITVINDATSIYVNPALAVEGNALDMSFTYATWFAELSHASASGIYKLGENDAIGVGFIALTSPDMDVTTVVNPDGTGEKFAYGDFVGSLTYSRRMTEQFSFGVTAKFVQQSIGSVSLSAALFDLGVCYRLDIMGIRLAAALQNFGGTSRSMGSANVFGVGEVSEFIGVNPPSLFRLGISAVPISDEMQSLAIYTQINSPNDNATTLGLGVEYLWNNLLALRAGYTFGKDEQTIPDFGLGLRSDLSFGKFQLDYAFVNFQTLGATHRFTLSFGDFKF